VSFSEFLTAANEWIVGHKELVTLVAVPLFTLIVTASINRSAEKRSNQERASAEERAVKERASHEVQAAKERTGLEERAAKERLLQLELSRRMKLADFRQNWIDQIRGDFSVILAAIPMKSSSYEVTEIEVNKCIQRVLLRMNPTEDLPKEIYENLSKMINAKIDEREDIAFDLTNKVNVYLKSEWERLKTELSEYDMLAKDK